LIKVLTPHETLIDKYEAINGGCNQQQKAKELGGKPTPVPLLPT
jgi:hypothetical protein